MNESVSCRWFPGCSGCDDIGSSATDQKQAHVDRLAKLLTVGEVPFPEIGYHRPAPWALRDRLDFSLLRNRLGLFDEHRENLVDLPDCGQLSPALQKWLTEFRQNLPPIERAAIRLRVAPDGRRGMWLDLANLDIKHLLDSREWLESWPADVVIEMGQRRKFVERAAAGPKFRDPVFHPWFSSKWRDREIPLYGVVGGFTQPSLKANEAITTWFRDRVIASHASRIVEVGSGNGNLSFPALSGEATLVACESEPLSVEGFKKTLEYLATEGLDLRDRVTAETGDFLRNPGEHLRTADLLIANPPRSGLRKFLDPLPDAKNLRHVLYMSCHADTFAIDAVRLKNAGFKIKELTLLDQFPQTKHIEVLSHWTR